MRRGGLVVVALSGVLGVACGSTGTDGLFPANGNTSNDSSDASAGDGAVSAAVTDASTAPGEVVDSGSRDASVPALDASAAKDADVIDAAAAVDAGPMPLYPVAVGRSWTARFITNNAGDVSTCTVTNTITGTSTSAVDGRAVFEARQDSVCSPTGSTSSTYEFSVVGDVVESWASSSNPPSWYRSVDAPVEVGHAWGSYALPVPNGQINRAWVSSGPVTVAAGSFDDCWTMSWGSDTVSLIGYDTYCRGVGYVQGNADYCPTCEKTTTELLSKNF